MLVAWRLAPDRPLDAPVLPFSTQKNSPLGRVVRLEHNIKLQINLGQNPFLGFQNFIYRVGSPSFWIIDHYKL